MEILVEHGAIGLFLYLWMVLGLVRLTTRTGWLGLTWPALLAAYLVNACCVVMNYQFVNALLFSFAGILASRKQILSLSVTKP